MTTTKRSQLSRAAAVMIAAARAYGYSDLTQVMDFWLGTRMDMAPSSSAGTTCLAVQRHITPIVGAALTPFSNTSRWITVTLTITAWPAGARL